MKMKWFDRILLVLVMLCMLAVSVALIGIALGVLNQPVEQLYSVMTNGLWVNSLILIVIGAVLITVGVIVALKKPRETVCPPVHTNPCVAVQRTVFC